MATLNIDGKTVKAAAGQTVLEAARGAGIKIPTLCQYEDLPNYGACRLCTVEIADAGRTTLQASCCYPAKDGLVVRTDTAAVVEGRKLLQLLLARCSASPEIRAFAAEWGVTETPFSPRGENCVLCGLCVRACASVMGVNAISFSQRGTSRSVSTPFGFPSDDCRACGACTFVCPTGAIQMEAERVERLRNLPAGERQCRYTLMGLTEAKLCPNNYDCADCAFDQSLELRFGKHPAFAVLSSKEK